MEPLFLQGLQGTLAHDQEIFISLKLAHKPVEIGKILGDFPVDQGNQKGTAHILHALQCFLIIVQIGKCNYQLVILILLDVFLKLGLVIEEHRYHADV